MSPSTTSAFSSLRSRETYTVIGHPGHGFAIVSGYGNVRAAYNCATPNEAIEQFVTAPRYDAAGNLIAERRR